MWEASSGERSGCAFSTSSLDATQVSRPSTFNGTCASDRYSAKRFAEKHMLAMKIDAARNSDEDDIGVLVDQLGITSADQALEIYRTVLPHTAAVDARRRELVSKIVDERVRNRR